MVTRAVTQLYDDALRPGGLRITQFSILASIARAGGANLGQLEDELAIDQTTLTRSLNRLERDRMIERVPHPDGRIKARTLTVKGRPLFVSRFKTKGGRVTEARMKGQRLWKITKAIGARAGVPEIHPRSGIRAASSSSDSVGGISELYKNTSGTPTFRPRRCTRGSRSLTCRR
jgi:DNA-binding MarR family transcriptional regulator